MIKNRSGLSDSHDLVEGETWRWCLDTVLTHFSRIPLPKTVRAPAAGALLAPNKLVPNGDAEVFAPNKPPVLAAGCVVPKAPNAVVPGAEAAAPKAGAALLAAPKAAVEAAPNGALVCPKPKAGVDDEVVPKPVNEAVPNPGPEAGLFVAVLNPNGLAGAGAEPAGLPNCKRTRKQHVLRQRNRT